MKMDEILETYNIPKLNEKEPKNLDRKITTSKIEAVVKKLSNKSLDQVAHRRFLPDIQRRTNTYASQSIPKNSRGGKTQLILRGNIIGQYPS